MMERDCVRILLSRGLSEGSEAGLRKCTVRAVDSMLRSVFDRRRSPPIPANQIAAEVIRASDIIACVKPRPLLDTVNCRTLG